MRYRPNGGRLILEMLYGNEPSIVRDAGTIQIDISQLARKLHLRPIRLCEALEWLRSRDILAELTLGRKYATVVLRQPQGLVERSPKKVWNGAV